MKNKKEKLPGDAAPSDCHRRIRLFRLFDDESESSWVLTWLAVISIPIRRKKVKSDLSEDRRIRSTSSSSVYRIYSTEAEVYQEGNNRINVDIPGVSDANAILEELGKPGSLIFVDSEGKLILDGKLRLPARKPA